MKQFILSLLVLLAVSSAASAQQQIQGYISYYPIYSNHGEFGSGFGDDGPVPDVTVFVKGTSPAITAISDADGKYSITLPQGYDILVFTAKGYYSEERKVEASAKKLDLNLIPSLYGGVIRYGFNQPLEGVTVSVKGAKPAVTTITNAEGVWEMEIPLGSDTLQFSADGFVSSEYPASETREINMEEIDPGAWSPEEKLAYVSDGHNLNKIFGKTQASEFHLLFWGWGFYCNDQLRPAIDRALQVAKEPIKEPLFFLSDPCGERSKDILDYFSALLKYNHGVTENDFNMVLDTYVGKVDGTNEVLRDWHKQDVNGKTVLMYACEFGYASTAKKLVQANADLSLKDKTGKTARDYAKATGKKEMMAVFH